MGLKKVKGLRKEKVMDSRMVVTRRKGRCEEAEKVKGGINGDERGLDLVW